MFTKQRLWIAVYLTPGLLVILLFIVYPLVQSIHYSFLDWNLVTAKKWIGLGNYKELFRDQYFLLSLKDSLLFILFSIVFQLGIALALAVLIYNRGKGSLIFRTIYFAPVVISSVAVALMFILIYAPDYGLLDSLLKAVGLGNWIQEWLSNPRIAFYFAIVPKIWQFVGIYVVIFFTGLIGIPRELLEAADIDGASSASKFLKVTLPMLREVGAMSIILISINTWKSFEQIWVLTGGGPAHTTEIVGTYMVSKTFVTFQYGYGSAISTIILVVGVLITVGLRYLLTEPNNARGRQGGKRG